MSQKNLFGTDGIRGKANEYPMTADVALRLGQAIAKLFIEKGNRGQKQKFIIGKDTRLSGYLFEQAISAGLSSMGAHVYLAGPLPTPAVAFLTENMRCRAGIMISASHNPYFDNGIKLFQPSGYKLTDELEETLSKWVQGDEQFKLATNDEIGKVWRIQEAKGRYLTFVKGTFPPHLSLEGLKIAIDCANGAAYQVAPYVFEELGAEVVTIGASPNGTNINHNFGALYTENLKRKVVQNNCDIGIAFDGDADRLVLVDETGTEIPGDHLIGLFSVCLKQWGELEENVAISTVMANMALENYLKSNQIGLIRTPVGDRNIIEEIRNGKSNFGGEPSGHLIFSKHSTTGDGLIAALQFLRILIESEGKASSLRNIFELFPQIQSKIKVKSKPPLEELKKTEIAKSKIEKELADQGRILVRYSGTEPVLRIMVECSSEDACQKYSKELTDIAKDEFNAMGLL